MQQERAYWLAWSQIKGIGAVSLKKIYQHFGSLQVAWNAPAIAFAEIDGINGKAAVAIQSNQKIFLLNSLLNISSKILSFGHQTTSYIRDF